MELTASNEDYSFFARRISLRFCGGPSGISPNDGWPFPVSFYPLREFLIGRTFQTSSELFSAVSALSMLSSNRWMRTTLVPALDVAAGNR
jgi:hypothetical protein